MLVAIALIVVGIHYIRRQFIANNEYDMEVTAVVTSVSKKYDKDEDQETRVCESFSVNKIS